MCKYFDSKIVKLSIFPWSEKSMNQFYMSESPISTANNEKITSLLFFFCTPLFWYNLLVLKSILQVYCLIINVFCVSRLLKLLFFKIRKNWRAKVARCVFVPTNFYEILVPKTFSPFFKRGKGFGTHLF